MKNRLLTLLIIGVLSNTTFSQTVGIGTNTPNISAALDVFSTNQGLLTPRLSTTAKNNISNPAKGLFLYDTTTSSFWFYEGNNWIEIQNVGLGSPIIQDDDNDTYVHVESTPDNDQINFHLNGLTHFEMTGPQLKVHNSGRSIFIGNGAGDNDNKNTNRNVFIGEDAGQQNISGQNNVAIGANSMNANNGSDNVAVGFNALDQNTTGTNNVALGRGAGKNNNGIGNVFLGNLAGYNEVGSGKLYIENGISATPLIYGDFDNDSVRINGVLNISNNYSFPRAAGTNNQILITNGSGNLSWKDVPGDDLGDHIATSNIQTNGHWISNDGDSEGLFVSPDGKVGVGTAMGTATLNVNGGVEDASLSIVADTDNSGEEDNPILYFEQDGGATTASIGLEGTAGTQATNSTTNALLLTHTGGDVQIITNGEARMTVKPDGEIGIGTSTPFAKIHAHRTEASGSFMLFTNANTTSNDSSGFRVGINNNARARLQNFENTDMIFYNNNDEKMRLSANGRLGIGRTAVTNSLEVNGEISSTSGALQVNSDARLKKDFKKLSGEETLKKLNQLNGITFYWNDSKTGYTRPEGVQYGFTAQNIQTVFPELVKTDKLGYLQTSYGPLDAVLVESIKELIKENNDLKKSLTQINNRLSSLENETNKEETASLK